MKLCDFCTIRCASLSPFQRPQHRPYFVQCLVFGAYFLCCHLLYITPICLFQWMALSSTLQRAPQSLPSFSECRYTRVWHPCFSTITGPLVRFWRVWVGDIFRLKVCIPLEVVPIDSCHLNDPIPPHKPCFFTLTGPLVRFWRVWVGDIFALKVCIPLEVVPINSCHLNNPIPLHKPCFFTLTGPLVRFWRVWVGNIFGLKVCIPLEVVPIDSCPLNDSIPPHKPASWLSHHNWPLGPLLEVLGRQYLQIEGVYSSCSCTH